MKRFAALLLALVLGLAVPTLATAQLGPTNVPAPLTAPTPSQAPAAPVDDEGGLSSTQILLMVGGAIVVVSVIAWVIVRDARSVAPAVRGGSSGGGGRSPGPKKSTRERKREQARKRNKAKAARNQRKHNRPR